MDQSLGTIYWFGFTNVDEIVEKHRAVDHKGRNPERAPARKQLLARRQTIARRLGWGIASAMSKADGCDGMLACPVAQRSPALSTARVKAPLSSAAVIRASARHKPVSRTGSRHSRSRATRGPSGLPACAPCRRIPRPPERARP